MFPEHASSPDVVLTMALVCSIVLPVSGIALIVLFPGRANISPGST